MILIIYRNLHFGKDNRRTRIPKFPYPKINYNTYIPRNRDSWLSCLILSLSNRAGCIKIIRCAFLWLASNIVLSSTWDLSDFSCSSIFATFILCYYTSLSFMSSIFKSNQVLRIFQKYPHHKTKCRKGKRVLTNTIILVDKTPKNRCEQNKRDFDWWHKSNDSDVHYNGQRTKKRGFLIIEAIIDCS